MERSVTDPNQDSSTNVPETGVRHVNRGSEELDDSKAIHAQTCVHTYRYMAFGSSVRRRSRPAPIASPVGRILDGVLDGSRSGVTTSSLTPMTTHNRLASAGLFICCMTAAWERGKLDRTACPERGSAAPTTLCENRPALATRITQSLRSLGAARLTGAVLSASHVVHARVA